MTPEETSTITIKIQSSTSSTQKVCVDQRCALYFWHSDSGPRLWSLTELVLLDIFRFTLYWTGIFYALTYGLCGIWAALIAGYASRRRKRRAITALLAFLPFLTLGSLSAVVGATVTGNAIRALSPCQCVSEALNRLCFGGGLLRRKFHNVNVSGRALI